MSTFFPPPVHRGLSELDRDLFKLEVPLLAARLPAKQTGSFRTKWAKTALLDAPRAPSIVHDPSGPDHRLVLLKSALREELPQELVRETEKEGTEVTIVPYTLQLDYDYWVADDILQAVLPEELLSDSPTSYTSTGHIAHLNLRDDYLPYRHLIGQVILDKNKNIRTVVNKLDTIDNVYRNFKMEVLAGDDDFNVSLSEHDCRFDFDFSLVYWNSRLQSEHARLVSTFTPDETIIDAFAGVGPFAIPAGSKGCAVYASDLNPASASALKQNAKLNKVEATVRTGNADARQFITDATIDLWSRPFPPYTPKVKSKARRRPAGVPEVEAAPTASTSALPDQPVAKRPRNLPDHFVMNLPASAIEFLGAYKGLYTRLFAKYPEARPEVEEHQVRTDKLPVVHCYCFTKEMDDPQGDILRRATQYLGFEVTTSTKDFDLFYVRDVAPKKAMYCLSFRLWEEVVFAPDEVL